MFNSTILDVAIGMVFVYLLLSLICSAANEIIERYSKKRAKDLEEGLREMLRSDDLVKRLYEHPLVYSLFPKPYAPGGKNLPSYIPARNFALALMDIAAPSGATGATGAGLQTSPPTSLANLRPAIAANDKLPKEIKQALLTFVDASLDNPAKIRENIEGWFDSSMDRVSGWYKRRSQLIVLLIGLGLAILLNVDSVALVRSLATNRAMRDSLVAAAQEYAKSSATPSPSPSPTTSPKGQGSPSPSPSPKSAAGASPSVSPASSPAASAVATVSPTPSPSPTPACDTPECRVDRNLTRIKSLGLPIGWTREVGDPRSLYGVSWQGWSMRILGWLVTALALSLGAPFWFDLLNKFIVIRSTVKPKEKSPEEKSKD
jgi:hypothetical protein